RSLSIQTEDPSGRRILEVTAGQSFAVDLAARRLTPEKWGEWVIRARLDRLPLEWARSLGSAVSVTGGSASGAVDLIWTGPQENRFAASEPLAADGIMVRKPDGSVVGPFTLRARPHAAVTPERLEAGLTGLQVGLPTGARLGFDGALKLPRDGKLLADLS